MPGVDYHPSPRVRVGDVWAAFYLGEDGQSGGIRESWGDDGLEIQIDFVIEWSDRIKLIQNLNGACSYDNGAYHRKVPIKIPALIGDSSPGLPGMADDYMWYRFVCAGAGEFKPLKWRTDVDGERTGIAGWGFYSAVIVPTHWRVPSYVIDDAKFTPDFPGADVSGYPYTTTDIKTSGEAFSPYAASYKFLGSGTQVDDAKVSLIRGRREITITRHYMPYVDFDRLGKMIGRVNKEPFVFGNNEYKAESLLYLGSEIESRPDAATGGLYYNIIHHIMANGSVKDDDDKTSSSWNSFITPDGKWDTIVRDLKDWRGIPGPPQPGVDIETPYKADFTPKDIWPDYEA